jgi:hypothetical protein
MTYDNFKQVMIAIKKGNTGIWIDDQGPYNNEDAILKMGYALSFVPLEYCERLLVDPDIVNLLEEAA